MPGSRKEKRGQVHKRYKESMFGELESKADIDRIFPMPRHNRRMPPDIRAMVMRDPSTLTPQEAKNMLAISEHYRMLHQKDIEMGKKSQNKNGKT